VTCPVLIKWRRSRHREKTDLPSSSKPKSCSQILKQKEEASHLAISSGQELVQMS
jgi:hypothetical protein